MSSSSEIIENLQKQIKLYQEMLENLKNNSDFSASNLTDPVSTPTPNSTSISDSTLVLTPTPIQTSVQNIFKPKKKYIKSIDILNLFRFTKAEYNNILVNINKVILKNFIFTYLIFFIFSLKFVFV